MDEPRITEAVEQARQLALLLFRDRLSGAEELGKLGAILTRIADGIESTRTKVESTRPEQKPASCENDRPEPPKRGRRGGSKTRRCR